MHSTVQLLQDPPRVLFGSAQGVVAIAEFNERLERLLVWFLYAAFGLELDADGAAGAVQTDVVRRSRSQSVLRLGPLVVSPRVAPQHKPGTSGEDLEEYRDE